MPRKKQDTPSRRLRVQVKLYSKDDVEPFAIEGDEIEEGVLSVETIEYLISEGKAEWVENK
jgi:hypothetical protein